MIYSESQYGDGKRSRMETSMADMRIIWATILIAVSMTACHQAGAENGSVDLSSIVAEQISNSTTKLNTAKLLCSVDRKLYGAALARDDFESAFHEAWVSRLSFHNNEFYKNFRDTVKADNDKCIEALYYQHFNDQDSTNHLYEMATNGNADAMFF